MSYNRDLVAGKLLRWENYLLRYTFPKWEELPDIELYMDQVLALLTQYLDILPRDEVGGKVITASTINNYVRMKIMPQPNKKRYGRIHLAYLIMICTLKQSVSMRYIQKIIPMGISPEEVSRIYNNYVERHRAASLYFIEEVKRNAASILAEPAGTGQSEDKAVHDLINTSAVLSGLTRILTEKLLQLQESEEADAK